MNQDLLKVLLNGRRCYINDANEVVALIDQPAPEGVKVYDPPTSTEVYHMMQDFIGQVDDFEQQSELMEAITFEQPFATFRQATNRLRISDRWNEFQMKAGAEWFNARYT